MKAHTNKLSYIIFCLGVVLSALVALGIDELRQQAIQEKIKGEMQMLAREAGQELQLKLEALRGVQSVFNGSERVLEPEFNRVAEPLFSRHQSLLLLQWAPEVDAAERAGFELRQQQQRSRYQIVQRSAEGGWQAAAERPRYFPVLYQIAATASVPREGQDLLSDPVLQQALPALRQQQTERSGQSLAVAVPARADDALKALVVLLDTASSGGNREGLLVAHLSLERVMQRAMSGLQAAGLHIALLDLTLVQQGADSAVLYARQPVTPPVLDLQQRYQIPDIGQRNWQLVVAPSEGYMAERKSELAYIVMLAGLLISGLLAAYVRMKSRRQFEIETVSAERQNALQEANKQLAHLSQTDGLTQIANRRFFDEMLTEEWSRTRREQQPISLVLFDLDFFKQYNDQYGHLQGDECLRSISEVIGSVINRPGDLFARFGGEEFVLLLPNTPQEGAMQLANQCRELVESLAISHHKSSVADVVTVSAGVCTLIPDSTSRERDLLDLTDQALYCAKDRGRNRVVNANDEGFSPRR